MHLSDSNSPANAETGNRTSNTIFNSITLCLVEAPWWLAIPALVFLGPLTGFYSYGVAFLVIGAIASMTITSLFSSWRGSIWIPQDVPAAIITITTVEIVNNARADLTTTDLFVTVVAMIAVSSWISGGFLYLLGKFHLGNLVRYLPYPVIAGFLGGTGWLLLKAGVDVSMGDAATGSYWHLASILHWLPAILLAVCAWWLGLRYTHPLLLPGLMLIATLAFHVLLLLPGWSLEMANSTGWMFSALTPESQTASLQLSDLSGIDWLTILQHSGAIIFLAVASVISMLLNNSGFELQIGRDFDINKDLRVAGMANLIGGMFGGWPGYMSPASSLINARQGQQLPLTGMLVATGVALIIWLAIPLLSLVPLFVIGSGVAYIGTLFIADWIFASYKRLPLSEYLVVLCIVATIALFGLAQGVIVGMLLTVALFLVSFSRVDVIRHQLTGEHRHSRVKRNSAENQYLQSNGHQVQLFQLQGYLFFGTANQLLETIRTTVDNTDTRFIVVDFERVSGVDSTAISSFLKLQKDADTYNITLILVGLNDASSNMIVQQFITANLNKPIQFDTIDTALESIEQQQLANSDLPHGTSQLSLNEYLQQVVPNANNIDRILALLERCELKAGDYLIRQGELATEMFFIESGSITAQIEHEDGSKFRLETMSHGVVGELAFYLGNKRSAAVFCNEDLVVYRLTRDQLENIEVQHPNEASTIHLILARLLSERTTHLVAQVNSLQK